MINKKKKNYLQELYACKKNIYIFSILNYTYSVCSILVVIFSHKLYCHVLNEYGVFFFQSFNVSFVSILVVKKTFVRSIYSTVCCLFLFYFFPFLFTVV